MIRKVGSGLLVILGLFIGYVAIQSPDYRVSREVRIDASAEQIFPHLNNSKLMNDWNPWLKVDPAASISFSGPEEGVGSQTSWKGGKDVGTGSATVVESVPNRVVRTQLEYQEPYPMVQMAELEVRPAESGSIVTWSVKGRNNFVGRLICVFMNMDKHIGTTFEKGLMDLKTRVENIK